MSPGSVQSNAVASLLGMTSARLRKIGAPLGELLEGFVARQIAHQLTWSETPAGMFHPISAL